MATRIPLVIVNGQTEQLQSGDQINVPAANSDVRVLTNGEASTALVLGMAVYASAAGAVKRGQANALSTAGIVGLVYDASITAAATGQICVGGLVTGTTVQWDAVAGTTGGLTFGTLYFLDPTTPGKITSVAPTTVGQVVAPVGRALSTTDMEVFIGTTVLL